MEEDDDICRSAITNFNPIHQATDILTSSLEMMTGRKFGTESNPQTQRTDLAPDFGTLYTDPSSSSLYTSFATYHSLPQSCIVSTRKIPCDPRVSPSSETHWHNLCTCKHVPTSQIADYSTTPTSFPISPSQHALETHIHHPILILCCAP